MTPRDFGVQQARIVEAKAEELALLANRLSKVIDERELEEVGVRLVFFGTEIEAIGRHIRKR